MSDYIWDLRSYRKNLAFIDDRGTELSYDMLCKESDLLFDQIGHRGLIFILCRNSIGSVLGYVMSIVNGIVPLLLNANIDEHLLSRLLDVYLPEFLWIPGEMSVMAEMKPIYSQYGYKLVKTNYKKSYPLNKDLALLLTTSGSTGSPKCVRQSYENIKSNTESIVKYLELDSNERPITTLPMNYTYGLSIINTHLSVGATVLLTDKGLMQKDFWSFFKKNCATSFGGVPYTYEMLDKLKFYRMELPSLSTMTQAGGKLSEDLHEKIADYASKAGKNFVVMYGQCEATARMGYLPPEMAVCKKGSMGIAIPGGHFSLVNDLGEQINDTDTVGELVYEGNNVTLGYAENGEDLIKADERHGRLETGDMARRDSDGYYYIVGRKKRFLKIYGNRVNLDEMDRLIKTRFDINVSCSGVDDHMYIFTDESVNSVEIKECAGEITGLNPRAFSVVVIDKIPRNDSGKVMYNLLEKYYE